MVAKRLVREWGGELVAVRVGFLFNHYAPHQVPHAAPYAFELSRQRPDWEVLLACSTAAEERVAGRIRTLYPGERTRTVRLRASALVRLAEPFKSSRKFKRKKGVLANNLDFFGGLDALVAPERHSSMLRDRFGLHGLALVHTRHGAGDRDSGFDERTGAFDLTLLAGQKILDRLLVAGRLEATAATVVGYPKLEVVRGLTPERPRLFANDNPVFVYNPHFDQELGSWSGMGRSVLDLFARRRDWNLIFAPHVVLFRRWRRHGGRLPWRYRLAPNILVDTGSDRSVDMTYTRAADVYVGDVSSQVYEFLAEPRPCVFLNAHRVAWRGDPAYLHWTLGEVVEDAGEALAAALGRAGAVHAGYLERQRAAVAYTFHDEPGSTAAERGAAAIARFLEARRQAAGPPDATAVTRRVSRSASAA